MAEPIARHTITHDAQDLTKPGSQNGALLAPLLPAGEPVEQLLREAQYYVPGGTLERRLPRGAPQGPC